MDSNPITDLRDAILARLRDLDRPDAPTIEQLRAALRVLTRGSPEAEIAQRGYTPEPDGRLLYTREPVAQWAKDLTEGVLGSAPFAVGDVVPHPSGRRVKIIGGQYWGTHGLSNHWSWREVLPDDSLSATVEHGYGWRT